MAHTHLTEKERNEIYKRKVKGESLTEIAERLGRSKSTISRELRRNLGQRGYRPKQAHELARARTEKRRGGRRVSPATLKRCDQLMRKGYSPVRAAAQSASEGFETVSYQTLYHRLNARKAEESLQRRAKGKKKVARRG